MIIVSYWKDLDCNINIAIKACIDDEIQIFEMDILEECVSNIEGLKDEICYHIYLERSYETGDPGYVQGFIPVHITELIDRENNGVWSPPIHYIK